MGPPDLSWKVMPPAPPVGLATGWKVNVNGWLSVRGVRLWKAWTFGARGQKKGLVPVSKQNAVPWQRKKLLG